MSYIARSQKIAATALESDMGDTVVRGGRAWGAVLMLCLTIAGLGFVQFADRLTPYPADVADAIAGEGVEVGRVDSDRGSLSVRSVNDRLVLLVTVGRTVGASTHPAAGPALCRMLDSPAMLAELHAALSAGMDRATVDSGYAMRLGDGGAIAVSSSGPAATVTLRRGRRVASLRTTADELRRLSDELAGFILRHGGGGTVRTPVP